MSLNITSKQIEITPAIRNHLQDQLAKLEKWKTQLINPHVTLSKEIGRFIADATINTPKGPLIARAKNNNMYLAINKLISKLKRQLNKLCRKPEAHRNNSHFKNAGFV